MRSLKEKFRLWLWGARELLRRGRPDITLATTMLGWKPEVAVREGLARTIASMRDTLPTGEA